MVYKLTRGVTAIAQRLAGSEIATSSQMALAESYIHGLEIPDSLLIPISKNTATHQFSESVACSPFPVPFSN